MSAADLLPQKSSHLYAPLTKFSLKHGIFESSFTSSLLIKNFTSKKEVIILIPDFPVAPEGRQAARIHLICMIFDVVSKELVRFHLKHEIHTQNRRFM